MRGPEAFRDHQIQRPTNRLGCAVPEYSLGTGIPELNDAVAVAGDDRVRRCWPESRAISIGA
jgi:hypothetical protein